MLEQLQELLRDAFEQPGKAFARLWFVWWLWTIVRNALKRKAEPQQEADQHADQEADARALEPTASEPVRAPAPPRAPTAAPSPRADGATRRREPRAAPQAAAAREAAVHPWQSALQRAHDLRLRVVMDRRLRWLEPILVDDVIEPLQAAHDRMHRAEPSDELERRGASALLTLQVLERVSQERAAAEATRLFEVDAIAQACQAPLAHYARSEDIALRGRTPLAVRFHADEALFARGFTHALLPLPVPHGLGTHLLDYTALVHQLGRRWYTALPELPEQLRELLDLPERMRLPDARRGYDERSVYASFGPWLPALFADIALTLRLGDGYVTGLRQQVTRGAAQATRARAQGGYLNQEPPGVLRMHAALHALSTMGRQSEAERHRAALSQALPDTTQSYLPLEDGRYVALATDYLLAITDEVARTLLQLRVPALSGAPLPEWPGVPQTLEDAREQVRMSQALASGQTPAGVDPVQLLCAALLAWESGANAQQLLAQLHRSLSPTSEAASHPGARVRTSAQPAPKTLRASFRDARTLHRAVVLGAALERPRASRAARLR